MVLLGIWALFKNISTQNLKITVNNKINLNRKTKSKFMIKNNLLSERFAPLKKSVQRNENTLSSLTISSQLLTEG